MDFKDFLTLPRLIAIAFWFFSVFQFHRSAIKRKSDLWSAIIGDNKRMDLKEVAAFYWVILFPEVIFLQLLIIVLNLDVRPSHLDLFSYAQLALTAIAASIIFKTKDKENEKEV